ncbi:MAG TPA: TraB/GumN family protein [Sphingomicrobium sp.]|jgi:uncharacterized protein YbaP (TraB family)|nr:TraB/GumN family protein [Sphingomicrobium sp.]
MTLINWVKRGLAALGIATAAAGCSSAATTPAVGAAVAKPALWQVADKDTTIYLFGTIHLLPEGYKWRTPRIDQAVSSANGLVVETIIDTKNPTELAGVMMRLGLNPSVPSLLSRVPVEKRAALQAAVKASGIPMAALDRMETWAAAFTLIGTQFRALGLQAEAGVETTLKSSFSLAGKPIGQLETNAEQLGFFDALPEAAQRELLVAALDQPASAKAQFDGMLAAWTRGDVDSIAKTFNTDMAGSPELMDALLRRRNANWAGWIEKRMAQPGTVMVAVGAGHLAGEASVQDLLQRRGLKVTRLQ